MKDYQTELFRRKVSEDVKAIKAAFTNEEHIQIAFVPLVYSFIAFHYADSCRAYSAKHRISILKRIGREYDSLKKDFHDTLALDLNERHIQVAKDNAELVRQKYPLDFLKMYFTVNNVFKKMAAKYPFDDMRSEAVCGLLIIKLLQEHIAEVNKMIRSRLSEIRDSVIDPHIPILRKILEAYAGVDGLFDYDDFNVKLAARVIACRIKQIKFNIDV